MRRSKTWLKMKAWGIEAEAGGLAAIIALVVLVTILVVAQLVRGG